MTATSEQSFRGGPRAALAVRPFRWWFAGQVFSASGLMTQMVAVGWLVLSWHGSGLELGLLSTAGLAPTLLLGLWAGSLVDHHDRRSILIWTQSLLLALSLVLYALIVSGAASYWPLIAITLASGSVNALDSPARQIYVLDLVGPERVAGAVSLYEVILNLSRVLGPGGRRCAAGNLRSGGLRARQRRHLPGAAGGAAPLPAGGGQTAARFRAARAGRPSALAGLRYAWSQPLLRACLLTGASCGVLFSPALFFPLLATRVFHMGGSGYGLLLALFGIGALPGALLASRRRPSGTQVRVLGLLTGACVVISATAPALPVLFIGILGTGACSIWMVAAANTLVQLRAAPELRGRVMGAWTVALPGTIPITALIAGAAADLFGPRVAYAGVGAVIAGVALACWRAYADPLTGSLKP